MKSEKVRVSLLASEIPTVAKNDQAKGEASSMRLSGPLWRNCIPILLHGQHFISTCMLHAIELLEILV